RAVLTVHGVDSWLVEVATHVPQLKMTELAAFIAEQDAGKIAGPGAVDMTRLALSSYEIWHDILVTNAGAIDAALAAYIGRLEKIRQELRSDVMREEFEAAAASARQLRDDETI